MRHECTSCEKIYGEGENKPKFGFCAECWGGALSEQRKNRNRAHAARPAPALDAYDPGLWATRIITGAAVEEYRRAEAGELAGWLDFYREIGWWCAWLTHWYQLGQSVKISST